MKLTCDYGVNGALTGVTIDLPEGALDSEDQPITTMTCLRRENNAYKPFKISREGVVTEKTYIICPNPVDMCDRQLFCPKSCNLNGRCLKSGKCWCYYGWAGETCDQKIPDNELDKQYAILNAAVFGSWVLKLSCLSLLLTMLNLELF